MTMKELTAEHGFEERQQTPMHWVDAVAPLTSYHAQRAASRASDMRSEMKVVGERRVLLKTASRALKCRSEAKLLQETPMDALERLSTVGAFIHFRPFYIAFAGPGSMAVGYGTY